MPARGPKLPLSPRTRYLLIGIVSLYTVGVGSLSYIQYNFLRYYRVFADIRLGMSKAEVHQLLKGWEPNQPPSPKGRRMGGYDVEEYSIRLGQESGDFVRICYKDSVVARKEAWSGSYEALTDPDRVRMDQAFRQNITWLTIGLVFGDIGIVSYPLACSRRRVATSLRERGINGMLIFVTGLSAGFGGAIVLGLSGLFSLFVFLLIL